MMRLKNRINPLEELIVLSVPEGIKAEVGQYPDRTNSVANSVRSTSMQGWYEANKGLPPYFPKAKVLL